MLEMQNRMTAGSGKGGHGYWRNSPSVDFVRLSLPRQNQLRQNPVRETPY
jgi:hypothetical protein